MTEVNLRLYISIFPRNCTETLVRVENFMQTTILMRTSHFSVLSYSLPGAKGLWQNSSLFLTTATERFWRRIQGKKEGKRSLINT
uniref:Uncharacterized protein n=1 Tax=Geospiza parvula TaxID=87175 RepID=A0A8C3N2J6_GEOPR